VPSISAIEGVGDRQAEKLRAAGIATVESLLANGNTKKRREKLAAETKISEKSILKWVNHADLMRIKGVSGQYSELLEAAGVDTVKELKHRNADNLAEAMEKTNSRKKTPLVRRTPSAKVVQKWIDQAKDLKAVVKY
jgi:predicted RecB family nuclease